MSRTSGQQSSIRSFYPGLGKQALAPSTAKLDDAPNAQHLAPGACVDTQNKTVVSSSNAGLESMMPMPSGQELQPGTWCPGTVCYPPYPPPPQPPIQDHAMQGWMAPLPHPMPGPTGSVGAYMQQQYPWGLHGPVAASGYSGYASQLHVAHHADMFDHSQPFVPSQQDSQQLLPPAQPPPPIVPATQQSLVAGAGHTAAPSAVPPPPALPGLDKVVVELTPLDDLSKKVALSVGSAAMFRVTVPLKKALKSLVEHYTARFATAPLALAAAAGAGCGGAGEVKMVLHEGPAGTRGRKWGPVVKKGIKVGDVKEALQAHAATGLKLFYQVLLPAPHHHPHMQQRPQHPHHLPQHHDDPLYPSSQQTLLQALVPDEDSQPGCQRPPAPPPPALPPLPPSAAAVRLHSALQGPPLTLPPGHQMDAAAIAGDDNDSLFEMELFTAAAAAAAERVMRGEGDTGAKEEAPDLAAHARSHAEEAGVGGAVGAGSLLGVGAQGVTGSDQATVLFAHPPAGAAGAATASTGCSQHEIGGAWARMAGGRDAAAVGSLAGGAGGAGLSGTGSQRVAGVSGDVAATSAVAATIIEATPSRAAHGYGHMLRELHHVHPKDPSSVQRWLESQPHAEQAGSAVMGGTVHASGLLRSREGDEAVAGVSPGQGSGGEEPDNAAGAAPTPMAASFSMSVEGAHSGHSMPTAVALGPAAAAAGAAVGGVAGNGEGGGAAGESARGQQINMRSPSAGDGGGVSDTDPGPPHHHRRLQLGGPVQQRWAGCDAPESPPHHHQRFLSQPSSPGAGAGPGPSTQAAAAAAPCQRQLQATSGSGPVQHRAATGLGADRDSCASASNHAPELGLRSAADSAAAMSGAAGNPHQGAPGERGVTQASLSHQAGPPTARTTPAQAATVPLHDPPVQHHAGDASMPAAGRPPPGAPPPPEEAAAGGDAPSAPQLEELRARNDANRDMPPPQPRAPHRGPRAPRQSAPGSMQSGGSAAALAVPRSPPAPYQFSRATSMAALPDLPSPNTPDTPTPLGPGKARPSRKASPITPAKRSLSPAGKKAVVKNLWGLVNEAAGEGAEGQQPLHRQGCQGQVQGPRGADRAASAPVPFLASPKRGGMQRAASNDAAGAQGQAGEAEREQAKGQAGEAEREQAKGQGQVQDEAQGGGRIPAAGGEVTGMQQGGGEMAEASVADMSVSHGGAHGHAPHGASGAMPPSMPPCGHPMPPSYPGYPLGHPYAHWPWHHMPYSHPAASSAQEHPLLPNQGAAGPSTDPEVSGQQPQPYPSYPTGYYPPTHYPYTHGYAPFPQPPYLPHAPAAPAAATATAMGEPQGGVGGSTGAGPHHQWAPHAYPHPYPYAPLHPHATMPPAVPLHPPAGAAGAPTAAPQPCMSTARQQQRQGCSGGDTHSGHPAPEPAAGSHKPGTTTSVPHTSLPTNRGRAHTGEGSVVMGGEGREAHSTAAGSRGEAVSGKGERASPPTAAAGLLPAAQAPGGAGVAALRAKSNPLTVLGKAAPKLASTPLPEAAAAAASGSGEGAAAAITAHHLLELAPLPAPPPQANPARRPRVSARAKKGAAGGIQSQSEASGSPEGGRGSLMEGREASPCASTATTTATTQNRKRGTKPRKPTTSSVGEVGVAGAAAQQAVAGGVKVGQGQAGAAAPAQAPAVASRRGRAGSRRAAASTASVVEGVEQGGGQSGPPHHCGSKRAASSSPSVTAAPDTTDTFCAKAQKTQGTAAPSAPLHASGSEPGSASQQESGQDAGQCPSMPPAQPCLPASAPLPLPESRPRAPGARAAAAASSLPAFFRPSNPLAVAGRDRRAARGTARPPASNGDRASAENHAPPQRAAAAASGKGAADCASGMPPPPAPPTRAPPTTSGAPPPEAAHTPLHQFSLSLGLCTDSMWPQWEDTRDPWTAPIFNALEGCTLPGLTPAALPCDMPATAARPDGGAGGRPSREGEDAGGPSDFGGLLGLSRHPSHGAEAAVSATAAVTGADPDAAPHHHLHHHHQQGGGTTNRAPAQLSTPQALTTLFNEFSSDGLPTNLPPTRVFTSLPAPRVAAGAEGAGGAEGGPTPRLRASTRAQQQASAAVASSRHGGGGEPSRARGSGRAAKAGGGGGKSRAKRGAAAQATLPVAAGGGQPQQAHAGGEFGDLAAEWGAAGGTPLGATAGMEGLFGGLGGVDEEDIGDLHSLFGSGSSLFGGAAAVAAPTTVAGDTSMGAVAHAHGADGCEGAGGAQVERPFGILFAQ